MSTREVVIKPAGSLAMTALLAGAQQADEIRVSAHAYSPPQLHLATQASLVELEAVVRDSRGRARAGLLKSDFEVLDEGTPREVAAFSVETRAAMDGAAPVAAAGGKPAAQNQNVTIDQ